MFNEFIKKNYTITYDRWYTERNMVNDGLEFQVDKGSAQNISVSKYLTAAHQSLTMLVVPNKQSNIAVFDNLGVRKCFCGIAGRK